MKCGYCNNCDECESIKGIAQADNHNHSLANLKRFATSQEQTEDTPEVPHKPKQKVRSVSSGTQICKCKHSFDFHCYGCLKKNCKCKEFNIAQAKTGTKTLSEYGIYDSDVGEDVFRATRVKQFIKDLKNYFSKDKHLVKSHKQEILERIDKLAGKELIDTKYINIGTDTIT